MRCTVLEKATQNLKNKYSHFQLGIGSIYSFDVSD
jgi:hypothetical protein